MIKYRVIYKCRLCGEEFHRKPMGSKPVTETTMHSCKDGSLGLADFVGYRKVILDDKHN